MTLFPGSQENTEPVEAFTFDVWGTLLVDLDPDTTWAERVGLVQAFAPDPALARAALDAAWALHDQDWSAGRPSTAWDLAHETLRRLGVEDEGNCTKLASAFSDHVLETAVVPVPGARETLDLLHDRGFQLGLICDTGFATGTSVRQILDRGGLSDRLAVQIYSDEWGAPKPHPRLFLAALAKMDVSAERGVHVGVVRRTDIAGAQRVGMRTVRLTAIYDDPGPEPEADLVVSSHEALREIVRDARARPRPAAASLLPPTLPDTSDRLDLRLSEGRVERRHVEALAESLAQRHADARCDDETTFPGTAEKLASEIHLLGDRVRRVGERPWVEPLEESLLAFVLQHGDLLRGRVLSERVRVVHGHLGPSMTSISDSCERVTIAEPFASPLGPAHGDTARDLVDLHGAIEAGTDRVLADRFVAAYAEASLDFRLYGVFEFHASLQALRRLAWYDAAARAGTNRRAERERAMCEVRDAEGHLAELASRKHARRGLVVATGGWVGTGKSTIAREAARLIGAPRIEVDRLREDLIDDPLVEPVRAGDGAAHEANWERTFAPGFTEAVYAELYRQARVVVSTGRPVVLDGCFGQARLRDEARRMARDVGARFVFVECRLDPRVHRERIEARDETRGEDPGTWADLADGFSKRWEPVTDLPAEEHQVVDTALDLDVTRAALQRVLAPARED